MKKSKFKYPDGGPLTYTTGTPEYEEYLKRKQAYEENNKLHQGLNSQGYTDYRDINNSERGFMSSGFMPEYDPKMNYRVYNTTSQPNSVELNQWYDPSTGRYIVPYISPVEEATIVKSQADLDAEKKQQEADEFKSKYQGYVTTQVPVQQEDGTWIMTTEAKPYPVGKEVPTDGTFHQQLPQGATVVQYAGGGKIGDTFKIAGDTLLSTIGLSDVIGDEAYKNQGFANASRVGETIGKYTGQIAGNILLPGIGGAAVKTGQNLLSNVDGEDERREYMDNISSLQSQGALGKFNAGAYSAPNGLNEVNALVTGAGEIGNVLSNPGTIAGIGESFSNFKLPSFPMGGELDRKHKPGLTLRPNKYGTQNYFDYTDKYLRESYVPTVLTDEQGNTSMSSYDLQVGGQTEKIGLLNSIKMAHRVNKNTRESGRDIARVKLNAFVDRSLNATPTFAQGGKFVEYNGPTHAGGGVPIDQNGMPNSQMKTAEVEGGETMHDDGIDKYIFSDRLVIDPKSKITFAEASKKINNKYKGTLDKIQKESKEAELNRLKQQQEEFKASMAQQFQPVGQSQMAYGGKMKYPDGGSLQYIPEDPNLGDDFELDISSYGFLPYSPEYYSYMENLSTTPSKMPVSKVPISDNIINPGSISNALRGNTFTPYSNEYLNEQEGLQYPTTTYKGGIDAGANTESKSVTDKTLIGDQLPQDKISPLGYAASNIGNVYDLFQASKPAEANDFGRVSLDRINLDPQRKELEKQANLAKNINRENVRSISTSSGQALTNQVIGNALANSTLGSGLSESFMSEINANNQISNQEELTNFQTKQNEILANQQDKALRQSTTSQALHGIGMNTQGYVRDIKSAQVGNKNNEMWFNAIKDSGQYVSLGTDANGNMVFKSKISGEIITKQI